MDPTIETLIDERTRLEIRTVFGSGAIDLAVRIDNHEILYEVIGGPKVPGQLRDLAVDGLLKCFERRPELYVRYDLERLSRSEGLSEESRKKLEEANEEKLAHKKKMQEEYEQGQQEEELRRQERIRQGEARHQANLVVAKAEKEKQELIAQVGRFKAWLIRKGIMKKPEPKPVKKGGKLRRR